MISTINTASNALQNLGKGFAQNVHHVSQAFARPDETVRAVEQPEQGQGAAFDAWEQDHRADAEAPERLAEESGRAQPEQAVTHMVLQKNALKANAMVLKVADRTVGNLLDTFG